MTQTPQTPQTPAGWFPDPQQPGQQRYWDGAQWTAHVQPVVGPTPSAPTSNKAIAALVLGIASIVAGCAFVTGIPAMVLGRSAMKEADASGGTVGGRGLAQVGFWTGLAGTVIGTLVVAAVVALFWYAADTADGFQETCSTITTEGSFTVEC